MNVASWARTSSNMAVLNAAQSTSDSVAGAGGSATATADTAVGATTAAAGVGATTISGVIARGAGGSTSAAGCFFFLVTGGGAFLEEEGDGSTSVVGADSRFFNFCAISSWNDGWAAGGALRAVSARGLLAFNLAFLIWSAREAGRALAGGSDCAGIAGGVGGETAGAAGAGGVVATGAVGGRGGATDGAASLSSVDRRAAVTGAAGGATALARVSVLRRSGAVGVSSVLEVSTSVAEGFVRVARRGAAETPAALYIKHRHVS